MTKNKREFWVDNVKVVACVLVVLGHLFQGLNQDAIIGNNNVFLWFNSTIYMFHVPLFFICSGYLYQKFSKVESVKSWAKNSGKKLLVLGVPYFTFTILTWAIKTVFSNAGNIKIDNIFTTLFLNPTAPFWFLYALFFVFLITPTFKNSTCATVGIITALIFKIVFEFNIISGGKIYAINTILQNEIWFVIGMIICFCNIEDKIKSYLLPILSGVIFIVSSVLLFKFNVSFSMMTLIFGLIACVSVLSFFVVYNSKHSQSKVMKILSKYTMAIFLMHPLFIATTRTILIKINVTNSFIYFVLEIIVGICGPIIVGYICEKSVYLNFFLNPKQTINQIKERKDKLTIN